MRSLIKIYSVLSKLTARFLELLIDRYVGKLHVTAYATAAGIRMLNGNLFTTIIKKLYAKYLNISFVINNKNSFIYTPHKICDNVGSTSITGIVMRESAIYMYLKSQKIIQLPPIDIIYYTREHFDCTYSCTLFLHLFFTSGILIIVFLLFSSFNTHSGKNKCNSCYSTCKTSTKLLGKKVMKMMVCLL